MSAALIRRALLAAKETTDPDLRALLVDMTKELSKFTWRKIEHAPRGYWTSNGGKGAEEKQIWHCDELWLYRAPDKHLVKGWWLPKEERWVPNMNQPAQFPTHFFPYKPPAPPERSE